MPCHVCLLSSRPYGTLYLGVTRDLGRRIVEHKSGVTPGFSARYGVHRLVWMEDHERIVDAIAREKQLKKWRRDWKIALIEAVNPGWADLFHTLNN
ncbi:GIY-YIG nuclease family protein [Lichenifustis flavocetrariae]|uniref:GIY-YIG nuclease family protein n=1 Tax=Lichenifustis flavocetrariae TaxID=2949735 RepID=A0AA41YZW2_9HYPH|nr:GIY-YIG nuclease family protein [Lichenifustis flavocetrariae]MCW6510297.1 GIY-YIG nuclease family protein [Lichenifustis flavocetrariae]